MSSRTSPRRSEPNTRNDSGSPGSLEAPQADAPVSGCQSSIDGPLDAGVPARLKPAGVAGSVDRWQGGPNLGVAGRTLFTPLAARVKPSPPGGRAASSARRSCSVCTTACAQAAHRRRWPAKLATAVGRLARHQMCKKPLVQPVHATRYADGNLHLSQQAPTQKTHREPLTHWRKEKSRRHEALHSGA